MKQAIYVTSEDGTKIWAEAAGDPSKPAVVFSHGMSGSVLWFEKQFSDERLLKNLYLIAYDMRGHGKTGMLETPEAYESIRFAQDLHAVCEAFKVKKPFFAGWSLGSLIPVDVVAAYGADYLSGVIYLGAVPWKGLLAEVSSELLFSIVPSMLSADLTPFHDTALNFIESCISDGFEIPYTTLMVWVGCLAFQTPAARKQNLDRTHDETRFLRECAKTFPILAVQGTGDKHRNTPALIARLEATFENLEVHLLEGAGHACFYERPEEFGDFLLKFVQRVVS